MSDESNNDNSGDSAIERKGFKKGKSGNEGGMTKHQAARRSALRAWLFSDPITEEWKQALRVKLQEGNENVIKWVGDHLLAKAPAASEDLAAVREGGANVLAVLTREEALAIAKLTPEQLKGETP